MHMAKGNADMKEGGICFICGQERKGAAAKEDVAIRAARKIRSLLHMPPRHTVACSECAAECANRRAAFEAKRKTYCIVAALFFAMVIAGQLFFGNPDARALVAAALGAAIIAGLAYTTYCPKFLFSEGK